MNKATPPYVIEPDGLETLLPDGDLLIVDVGSVENYHKYHVPGAVHLAYQSLTLGQPPAPGMLPPLDKLRSTLESIGLKSEKHVIAYDDQGNGRASRLLWTLEVVGHRRASLLNGGLTAWLNEGHPAEQIANVASTSRFPIEINDAVIADKEYVLASLDDPEIVILDARSSEEHHGLKSPSLRNGRIPGAVNLDWLDTIDRNRNARFKSAEEIDAALAALDIDRQKEVITHCQTHHRSSHSFVMLRYLGFDKIRGYPGSWSEWGNDPALPIE